VTGDALFTGANWRPRYTRVEPLPDSDLLIRVLLIEHRREPGRAVLITECLRRGDGGKEMINLGGSALTLTGPQATPELCRRLFDEAVGRLLAWREEDNDER
jgi:hypothetical protein